MDKTEIERIRGLLSRVSDAVVAKQGMDVVYPEIRQWVMLRTVAETGIMEEGLLPKLFAVLILDKVTASFPSALKPNNPNLEKILKCTSEWADKCFNFKGVKNNLVRFFEGEIPESAISKIVSELQRVARISEEAIFFQKVACEAYPDETVKSVACNRLFKCMFPLILGDNYQLGMSALLLEAIGDDLFLEPSLTYGDLQNKLVENGMAFGQAGFREFDMGAPVTLSAIVRTSRTDLIAIFLALKLVKFEKFRDTDGKKLEEPAVCKEGGFLISDAFLKHLKEIVGTNVDNTDALMDDVITYLSSRGYKEDILRIDHGVRLICNVLDHFNNARDQQKMDERPVILMVGDSVTAGLFLQREEGYVKLLADKAPQLQIINCSVSGRKIEDVTPEIQNYIKDFAPVSQIVFALGGNNLLLGDDVACPYYMEDMMCALVKACNTAGVPSNRISWGLGVPTIVDINQVYQEHTFPSMLKRIGEKTGMRVTQKEQKESREVEMSSDGSQRKDCPFEIEDSLSKIQAHGMGLELSVPMCEDFNATYRAHTFPRMLKRVGQKTGINVAEMPSSLFNVTNMHPKCDFKVHFNAEVQPLLAEHAYQQIGLAYKIIGGNISRQFYGGMVGLSHSSSSDAEDVFPDATSTSPLMSSVSQSSSSSPYLLSASSSMDCFDRSSRGSIYLTPITSPITRSYGSTIDTSESTTASIWSCDGSPVLVSTVAGSTTPSMTPSVAPLASTPLSPLLLTKSIASPLGSLTSSQSVGTTTSFLAPRITIFARPGR
jgi:hypothetical protein